MRAMVAAMPPQGHDCATRRCQGARMKTIFFVAALATAVTGAAAPAQGSAAVLGPYAARCAAGDSPAILVSIVGLKSRSGTLRLRTFGGASSTWFDKKTWLTRVEVPTPASGPVRFCLPVAAPGTYALDLRHDVNGNGDTDRADGGGASGDPRVSLLDFLFGRKPSPKVTAVRVGKGVTEITITAMYLSGGALRPVKAR
jgi:uncharacterized protein (DUF2141 family)